MMVMVIRVLKENYSSGLQSKTYYVRDASGNIMAVYKKEYGTSNSNTVPKEFPVYGLGRVGVMYNDDDGDVDPELCCDVDPDRTYELSDHLGNVRMVLAREKTNSLWWGDVADVQEYSDY